MSATARPRLASGSRLSAKQNDSTSLQNGNPAFNGVDNHPDFRRQGGQVQSLRAPGRQELQEPFKLPQTSDVVQRPYITLQIGANIGAIPAAGVKMRLQQRFRVGTPQARLNERHTRLQNQMLLARTRALSSRPKVNVSLHTEMSLQPGHFIEKPNLHSQCKSGRS